MDVDQEVDLRKVDAVTGFPQDSVAEAASQTSVGPRFISKHNGVNAEDGEDLRR